MPSKSSEASRRGKASRRKGKVFEQEIARKFREIYGESVKRGWQAREGFDAPDVDGTPWWVECKHHARVNVQASFEQAVTASTKVQPRGYERANRPPVLVHHDSGKPHTLVTLRLEDFLALCGTEAVQDKLIAGLDKRVTELSPPPPERVAVTPSGVRVGVPLAQPLAQPPE